jgi:hypothetical protein
VCRLIESDAKFSAYPHKYKCKFLAGAHALYQKIIKPYFSKGQRKARK